MTLYISFTSRDNMCSSALSCGLLLYIFFNNKKQNESEEKLLCALSFCVCSVLIIAQDKRMSLPKMSFGHSFVLHTSSTSRKSLMIASCMTAMLTTLSVIIFLFSLRKKNQSATISRIFSASMSCLQQERIW